MFTDLPNILTLSRIALIPVLIFLLVLKRAEADVLACVLFIGAAFTDYLDGRIARAWQQHSDLGRILDPIADKLLVASLLMTMAGLGHLSFYGTLYAAIIIVLRELMVSGLREYLAGVDVKMPVTYLAKWKTAFQMVAIGLLIAGDSTALLLGLRWLHVMAVGGCILWVAAILTLVTGWDYLTRGLRSVEKNAQGKQT